GASSLLAARARTEGAADNCGRAAGTGTVRIDSTFVSAAARLKERDWEAAAPEEATRGVAWAVSSSSSSVWDKGGSRLFLRVLRADVKSTPAVCAAPSDVCDGGDEPRFSMSAKASA